VSLQPGTRIGPYDVIAQIGADASAARAHIVIVQNWTEELKRLVPVN
jgi:hypothetical protein